MAASGMASANFEMELEIAPKFEVGFPKNFCNFPAFWKKWFAPDVPPDSELMRLGSALPSMVFLS